MNAAHGFMRGFFAPLKGIELILAHRRVRRLALVPMVLTALVFLVGVFFGLPGLTHLIPFIAARSLSAIGLAEGTWAAGIFYWAAVLFAWPAGIFALFYLLFLFARLIATPFYAMLAEAVLVERGFMPEQGFRFREWLATNSRLVRVSMFKLLVFTLLAIVLFLLSLIPGLGVFTAFGFLLLAAFDIVDLTFEALGMGFQARWSWFFRDFSAFAGLACALGLVFLIPGLNFFLFPAAIAGASQFAAGPARELPRRS